jgi:RimJ/RimL family protein N-acetyltransferase
VQGVTWGNLVGIRPLWPTDAGVLRRMMMDPEVAHLLFEEMGGDTPSTFALGAYIFLQGLTGRPDFGIVEKDGHLIGSVRLWRISERNRSAMLTIFIGDKNRWGRGCGTEALRLMLRHAFTGMDLNRVELHVFDFNGRAIRAYEKVGFMREGARRGALIRSGRMHDIVVMGILKDEFFARETEREAAPTVE